MKIYLYILLVFHSFKPREEMGIFFPASFVFLEFSERRYNVYLYVHSILNDHTNTHYFFMFRLAIRILKMSRKMYAAEEIAEILINLPNNNSADTDVEKDCDKTDADITIDNLPPPVD